MLLWRYKWRNVYHRCTSASPLGDNRRDDVLLWKVLLTVRFEFQLVLCALVAVVGVVLAAPQNAEDIQLLRFDSDNDGLGNYNFM